MSEEFPEVIETPVPSLIDWNTAVDMAYEVATDRFNKTNFTYGSGLPKFNEWMGGISQNELVVIAADTGIGKSEFTWGIAKENARNDKVAYIGLEMTPDKYVLRMVQSRMGIEPHRFKTMDFTEDEKVQITQVLGEIAGKNHNIMFFNPKQKSMRLESFTELIDRYAAGEDGIKLWVVDGIHNFPETAGQGQSVTEAVAGYTLLLDQMCIKHDIACVVTAQFRKKAYGEQEHMDLLKDSSTIKQKAHTVLLLSRDTKSSDVIQQNQTRIELHKSRDGIQSCTSYAHYNRERGRYEELGRPVPGIIRT